MDPKTRIFHAADGEDLVILPYTVFDWSTHVIDRETDRWTDKQTDGLTDGRTELWWLRSTRAVAAVARKNRTVWTPDDADCTQWLRSENKTDTHQLYVTLHYITLQILNVA